MNANLNRDTVLFDTYAGLRALGYTWLGAIRALRTLGISLAEAKAAHDRYNVKDEAPEPEPEPDLCPACGRLAILSDAKERGVQFTEAVCEECRDKAIKDSQMDSYDRDYERQRARGWAD